MARPACVIFDMDGVLCHYDFDRRMQIMADGTGVPASVIVERIYASGFDERADFGDFSADGYMAELSRRLGVAVPLELWLRARRESLRPNREMLALARGLGRTRTIAMLTNNGPVLQQHMAAVFPEPLEIFGPRAFFSWQFGTGKPDPEVFHRLLARIGHAPQVTLFIDDTASYVAGARSAGLQALHFTALRDLPEWLRELAEP